MKKFRRLVITLLVMIVFAGVLSVVLQRRHAIQVEKGFTYGPASAQVRSTTPGTFTTVSHGFPSSYRETQVFRPSGDVFSESSVETQPFNWLYIISNMVFWMGLFVALLSPFTIFYRPKKHVIPPLPAEKDVKALDENTTPPVKKVHENSRH